MNALILLLIPVALAASPDSRIVNGTIVNISDFPWQGSYRSASGSHTCGCVFVGGNVVLTAGHCGGSSSYSMTFGSSVLGGGTVYNISSVIRHPNYGQGEGFAPNDISIVRSSSNLAGTNISPGSLPSSSNNPGGNGWITGWGRPCDNCGIQTALRGAEIPIISDSECSERWGSEFQSSNMICVYSGSSGACNGDSGGPLSQDSTIYGLTSWGVAGCGTHYPYVYCRLGTFTSWVCSETDDVPEGC